MKQKIGHWLPIAVVLQFGVLASSAQTGIYLFTGSETTITLNPGLYDITAYGAQGGIGQLGSPGGLGAEMGGRFSFSVSTTLTLLVGGVGGDGPIGNASYTGGGGGGGSFVVNGATPLVIAGAGGGGGGVGTSEPGGAGRTGQSGQAGGGFAGGAGGSNGGGGGPGTTSGCGGGGGGFYGTGGSGYFDGGGGGSYSYLSGGAGGSGIYNGSLIGGFGGYGGGAGAGYGYGGGGGGGGYSGGGGSGGDGTYSGGGGGSYIDATAIAVLTTLSGVASPNGSPNGEIIITAVPEPTTLALVSLGGLSLLLLRRNAPSSLVDGHMERKD